MADNIVEIALQCGNAYNETADALQLGDWDAIMKALGLEADGGLDYDAILEGLLTSYEVE